MDLCYSVKLNIRIICNALIVSFLSILNVVKAEPLAHSVELYVGIVSASSDITFYLSAESAVWGANKWDDDFLLTDLYDMSQFTAKYENSDISSWKGWNFVLSTDGLPGTPVFGYGLYKFSKDENHYFYLDYRDDRYGAYKSFGTPYGAEADLWIKYDASIGRFYYSTDGSDQWVLISAGDSLSIWEIKEMGDPSRDRFQPTNPSGLTVTTVNNHPKLTWTESSAPPAVPKYHVYRSSESVYHCIASYLDTNTYTDDDVTFNKFGETYHYKIRAVSGDSSILSPGYSNVVTFLGDGPIERKIVADPVNEQPDYLTLKVFPNPFNHTVRIQFQLSSDKLCNTEIYGLQGHCVWDHSFTAQNGEYSFSWNGSDRNGNILPSGIYFMIVKSGRHSIFREKLIYLK